ncbi:PQ loop repeat-domain-containing protein [Mycena belliarum]|uniref:PQ loop repeat-domain-containing protein n=1 Tax=Mycena belliarum TaxID=1033014 RepID=A0AAD6UFX6_9AGAR|nr:PQ loop repeat-domain-containing protein [Mycena belliae]
MPANVVAENVMGTIGTICWTVQMVPQIYKSYHDKSTEGLSPWLVLVWGGAAAFLGAYTILLNLNIPLILQPQLFGVLAFVSWGQCQFYGARRSALTSTLMALAAILLVGGFQAALVFGIRPAYEAGSPGAARGVQFIGLWNAVLLALALVPQYVEIWQHNEVMGISLVFMAVDLLGGVFNDLSLAFKDKFDAIAGVTFTLVIVMDGSILLLALILNPRAARRRRRRAELESGPPPMEEVSRPALREFDSDATAVSSTRADSSSSTESDKIETQAQDAEVPVLCIDRSVQV